MGRPTSFAVDKASVIRDLSIQSRHLEQPGHHPGRLLEWQLEQQLERQAELDRGVRKDVWPPWALKRREASHILAQPDQQRPALSERGIVVRPVGYAVASRVRLAHAAPLTNWIRDVKHLPLEFRNNAGLIWGEAKKGRHSQVGVRSEQAGRGQGAVSVC